MDAPREDLIRSTPLSVTAMEFVEHRDDGDGDTADGDGDGRTMIGYPVVFNQWAEINSMFEGHFLERLDPGSLDLTLEQRADKIPVMFNHGFDPAIGDKPLGKPSLLEARDYGLWAEVRMSRTSYNDDLIALMRDGALWGQSFRFGVRDERWNDQPERSEHNPEGLPERTLMEVALAEFGPVTFPAYQATTLGIRSASAFQSWQRQPLEVSASVSPGDAPDSPPEPVPVVRQLAEMTRPRRAVVLSDLTRYLEKR